MFVAPYYTSTLYFHPVISCDIFMNFFFVSTAIVIKLQKASMSITNAIELPRVAPLILNFPATIWLRPT